MLSTCASIDRAEGQRRVARYSMSDENGFPPRTCPVSAPITTTAQQNLSVTLLNPASKRLLPETRFGFARMRLHAYGENREWRRPRERARDRRRRETAGSDAFGLPRFDIQGYDPIGDYPLCTPAVLEQQFSGGEGVTWSAGAIHTGSAETPALVWTSRVLQETAATSSSRRRSRASTSLADGPAIRSRAFCRQRRRWRSARPHASMNMRQTYDAFVQDDGASRRR